MSKKELAKAFVEKYYGSAALTGSDEKCSGSCNHNKCGSSCGGKCSK